MSFDLFGSNFLEVRNKYVIPSISYGINKKKHEFWSFKEIITNNLISFKKLTGKSFEIELSKSDYYKALHCDIELFMNKIVIQYSDFVKSKGNSPTWSFVTLYYFAFFNITCLFRFLNRGFIFLSNEQKRRFEHYSMAVYSNIIELESGNYYFNLKEENDDGNIVLTLTAKGDTVHKSSWLQLESTIRDFLPYSDSNEAVIFNVFLGQFAKFRTEFPSQLRNKLNYNGESSILDLDGSLPKTDLVNIKSDFIKGILKLSSDFSIINQIDTIRYLSSYFFSFNSELYDEYRLRSDFGEDFFREREKYLRINNITIPKRS